MFISKSNCEEARRDIKIVADFVNALRRSPLEVPISDHCNSGEAVININLAYRHLEDASMRLGKAIQALDGGVSVYNKTQVPETTTALALHGRVVE